MNVEAAKLAKKACSRVESEDEANGAQALRRRFVAGAIGPLNKTLSISPSVEDPGFRDTTWQACVEAYSEQVKGLMDGGVDILMVETIFDTLNSKAAIYAILNEFEARNRRIPVFISGTIVDQSGRTLSGQTTEAFYSSIRHVKPFAVGLNCALGAKEMLPFLRRLSMISECRVLAYPNAGLPNQMGEYDQPPKEFANELGLFMNEKLVNMVGGCCGTSKAYIKALSDVIGDFKPRPVPKFSFLFFCFCFVCFLMS